MVPREFRVGAVTDAAFQWLRGNKIEPPSTGRLQRFVDSAERQYDQPLCQTIHDRLSAAQREALDKLLDAIPLPEDEAGEGELIPRGSVLQNLRTNSEKRGVESVEQQIEKVRLLRKIGLSHSLFADLSPHVLARYRERAATESPSHFRVQAAPVRLTLLAAFCVTRMTELTDSLVTHLIDMVHHINVRAERRVEKKFVKEFRKVNNKERLWEKLLEAVLAKVLSS
ncbi:hypothetical protein Dxin01_03579 [Deinococcus xinjiangensis]|uniref:Uncharacterized protein n=1 Tax=Deinococcus xinjiangensis TaxID=457454 RepID=A0ABP9VGD3_9DEIO